jgi:hypothetical protein
MGLPTIFGRSTLARAAAAHLLHLKHEPQSELNFSLGKR